MKHSPSFSRRNFLGLGTGVVAAAGFAAAGERNLRERPVPTSAPESNPSGALAALGKPLRPFGIFMANHNGDTGLRWWAVDRWKREIADLKRMGANALWYLPFEFGQRAPADFEDRAPHWILQKEICGAIADAKFEVGIYVGLNDVFPEFWNAHPDWHATKGDYFLEQAEVCPSIPEARQEMLRLRERLYAGLPHLDYVLTPITDYGGCGCDKCAPYPHTFLRVLEEQAAVARRYHPQVKIVITGISASVADNDMLRELLPKTTWIDCVWDLPRGPKPLIRAGMLPETTMVNGWGQYGPCPVLADIQRGYQVDRVNLSGVAQYCEGIHDDVNRFALLQFAQNPQRSVQDVAQAYAANWLKLAGHDAALAAEVITSLGTEIISDRLWTAPDFGADNPQGDDRVKILQELRSRSRGLEDNYRYWLLHYRAVCESFCARSGSLSVETLCQEADAARSAFIRLEPAYGQFIAKLAAYHRPGRSPWNWPRSFKAAWAHENSFV